MSINSCVVSMILQYSGRLTRENAYIKGLLLVPKKWWVLSNSAIIGLISFPSLTLNVPTILRRSDILQVNSLDGRSNHNNHFSDFSNTQ